MSKPLADRLRPQTLDEVVGQKELIGPGSLLRKILESGRVPNLIFYGPSGVGKTTVARIIAGSLGKKLYKLNGTTASTADIRAVVEELDTLEGRDGVILYLDEIQYLNKKQQQTLLEFIETGEITLIASTTENPYFYIYNAILSRSTVFEFKMVEPAEVQKAVLRALEILGKESGETPKIDDEVLGYLAVTCGGDVRKALGATELCWLAASSQDGVRTIRMEDAQQVSQRSNMRYDRDGDEHYDILSAFQKSIRGSDENAAVHYLARLLSAGDLLSVCRRLLVIAAEDIGLAYPQAITIVKACVDAALQLGLPEAQLPLSQAVVLLATSPKSNSSAKAIWAAMDDVKNAEIGSVPLTIRDTHYGGAKMLGRGGYLNSHDYPNHYVEQQYLPDPLVGRVYYEFGQNKNEQAAKAYRERITGKKVEP